MRTKTRWHAATALALLALLAACAPGAPDAEAFRDRAGKVCRGAGRELAALSPPRTDAEIPAYADRVLAINEANSSAIRRLAPPAEVLPGVRAMLAEVTRINLGLTEASAAAEEGDRAAVEAALARIDTAAERLDARARELGIPACGGPGTEPGNG